MSKEVKDYYDENCDFVEGAGLIWFMARDHLSPSHSNDDEVALNADNWRDSSSRRCIKLANNMGIESGSRVLDIGAGIGGSGRDIIRNTNCKLVGINISEKQISTLIQLTRMFASDLLKNKDRNNLNFYTDVRLCDVQNMVIFPENTFDYAVSINMFYHVPSPEKALSEIRRVLKNGGKFGIDDWFMTKNATKEIHDRLRHIWSSPEGFHYISDIRHAMERFGFSIESEIDFTDEAGQFLTEERFGKTYDTQVAPRMRSEWGNIYPDYNQEEYATQAIQTLREDILLMGELYRAGKAVYKQIIGLLNKSVDR